MYKNATASLQINGSLVGQIPIQSAIRQGCPLSMALYTLCVHPLLRTLESSLTGVSIGERGQRISALAYADEITVLISNREDIDKVHHAVRIYEKATGAQLNPNKSRTIAVGGWREPISPLGIEFSQHVTILGVTFGPTMEETIRESWKKVTNAVRAQARIAYARNLCLAHRVKYVNIYLLSKIWYLAQVLPPPTCHTQQLKSTCTWFIWKGAIFRVPITTLQRTEKSGGWALPDIALKCRALLFGRMRTLTARKDSATAALLGKWNITDTVENPPHISKIPSKLVHVRQYALVMAYVAPQRTIEIMSKQRSRIYQTLKDIQSNTKRSEVMRIVRKYPEVNWKRLWTNLHTAWISDAQRSTWYMVIHDLIPTNDRLAAIKFTETNHCSTCDAIDTTQHRLTQCGERKLIWNWTRARIAAFTRTNSVNVPETWTIKPDFQIWPPQRHKAIMWMISQLVNYHMQGQRRKSLEDYIDFMRRARWKAESRTARQKAVGNYLSILDPPSLWTTQMPRTRHTLGNP